MGINHINSVVISRSLVPRCIVLAYRNWSLEWWNFVTSFMKTDTLDNVILKESNLGVAQLCFILKDIKLTNMSYS